MDAWQNKTKSDERKETNNGARTYNKKNTRGRCGVLCRSLFDITAPGRCNMIVTNEDPDGLQCRSCDTDRTYMYSSSTHLNCYTEHGSGMGGIPSTSGEQLSLIHI